MKIVFDLDGTICSLRKKGQDYSEVIPNRGIVEYIKELKDKGHYIIIQTARHMETCNGNLGLINARIGKKTIEWLEKYNIPFDEIFFGKPNADIYIDDKVKLFSGIDSLKDLINYDKDRINVIIPMAGAGSRFKEAGYKLPKPLIDVKGKKMVEWAVSSFDFLREKYNLKFIFIVLKEHIEKYKIDKFLEEKYPGSTVVPLKKITRGQAETCLQAKDFINPLEKLIIYNADTYSKYDLDNFPIEDKDVDGIIPCFKSNDSRYSYAKLDKYGYVEKVVEKKVISDNATNGLYCFRLAQDFFNYAEQMIKNNEVCNGEFYVGPVYNKLIENGKRIVISDVKENWVLGTPEELDYFLSNYKD